MSKNKKITHNILWYLFSSAIKINVLILQSAVSSHQAAMTSHYFVSYRWPRECGCDGEGKCSINVRCEMKDVRSKYFTTSHKKMKLIWYGCLRMGFCTCNMCAADCVPGCSILIQIRIYFVNFLFLASKIKSATCQSECLPILLHFCWFCWFALSESSKNDYIEMRMINLFDFDNGAKHKLINILFVFQKILARHIAKILYALAIF